MKNNGVTKIMTDELSGSKVLSIKNTSGSSYTPNLKFTSLSGVVGIEFDIRIGGEGNLLYAYDGPDFYDDDFSKRNRRCSFADCDLSAAEERRPEPVVQFENAD